MHINKPYLYLQEDEKNKVYLLNVCIMLRDYKVLKNKIINPNTNLDPHDNERRVDSTHPYFRNMKRAHVQIDLDYLRGHFELWSFTYKLKYADIKRGDVDQSEMIQVIIHRNDSAHDHDGSSVAHLGDPD